MPRSSPSLRASHIILRALVVLNIFFGLVFVLMLVSSLLVPASVFERWASDPDLGGAGLTLTAFRWVLIIAILSIVPAHLLLTRLAAIVASVRSGDAFTWTNARRLTAIAWLLLVLNLLDLLFGVVDRAFAPATEGLEWSFSITAWLAVLLLFVLARVFEDGARMREDLEGTV